MCQELTHTVTADECGALMVLWTQARAHRPSSRARARTARPAARAHALPVQPRARTHRPFSPARARNARPAAHTRAPPALLRARACLQSTLPATDSPTFKRTYAVFIHQTSNHSPT
eukprot:364653-Chlamydomonas_euryale.AAC.6